MRHHHEASSRLRSFVTRSALDQWARERSDHGLAGRHCHAGGKHRAHTRDLRRHAHAPRGVPRATVYVHAGQWSTTRSWSDTLRFLDWFKALAGMKVLVRGPGDACASPEATFATPATRGVVYLENERAIVAGLTFWGGPWVDDEPLPQLGAALAPVPDRVDVLVTHGAPRTEPAAPPTHRDRAAATLLAEVIAKRPRLHVFARGRRGTAFGGQGRTPRASSAPRFGARFSVFVLRSWSGSRAPALRSSARAPKLSRPAGVVRSWLIVPYRSRGDPSFPPPRASALLCLRTGARPRPRRPPPNLLPHRALARTTRSTDPISRPRASWEGIAGSGASSARPPPRAPRCRTWRVSTCGQALTKPRAPIPCAASRATHGTSSARKRRPSTPRPHPSRGRRPPRGRSFPSASLQRGGRSRRTSGERSSRPARTTSDAAWPSCRAPRARLGRAVRLPHLVRVCARACRRLRRAPRTPSVERGVDLCRA